MSLNWKWTSTWQEKDMRDGKPVILCIDDDQDVLDALRPVLTSRGYLVTEAASAEEGLRSYKADRPDLIIVDLMMEEIDAGTSFVRDLQAQGNKAPIFMLSSVGDSLDSLTSSEQLGLSGVFQKPVDPAVLLATLQQKLGAGKR
jgi:CheY-like chemotaxis protein